jgi:hypothetical protein
MSAIEQLVQPTRSVEVDEITEAAVRALRRGERIQERQPGLHSIESRTASFDLTCE